MNDDSNNMADSALHDLFMHELRGMYDVETRLVDMLRELQEATANDTIADGFSEHQETTRRQVERLEDVFDELGAAPEAEEHPMLNAVEEERDHVEDRVNDPAVRDLFYLGAGIKVERMEISGYESMLFLAKKMDLDDDITDPLEENLDEEEDTLKALKGMKKGSTLKSLINKITP